MGPNTTLISHDIESAVRRLKNDLPGQVDVSGTIIAQSCADWGLIDEYQLLIHPVALGSGKPFFAGPRPDLHLAASDRIGARVIRLTFLAR